MSEPRDDQTGSGDGPLDGLIENGLRFGFSKESMGSAGRADDVTRANRVRLRDPLREKENGDGARVADAEVVEEADSTSNDAGRYALGPEIARGGVGAVYRGRDRDLGRDVALKVLLERHLERPELVNRFLRESQLSGQLQHPGVVPVYDVGLRPDRRPFFSMKLVRGKTLAALLDERKSPAEDLRRFLGIFEKVLDAVAYAHACGVIHRDLKPSNVMVGAFGEVQVMDWGLAKVLGETGDAAVLEAASVPDVAPAEPRSETGSVMGTPAYMPPEQARGEVERLDERADVFALGAILCETLTGAPPYVAGTARAIREQAAEAKLDGAFARLTASEGDPELIALARRCLAAERDARPRNAGEVAEAFTAHLASVEERARAAELEATAARVKAEEERRAKKLTMALAATILVAVIGGGGGFLWFDANRRARVEANTRAVNDAIADAGALRERARAAGANGAWGEAHQAAKRAVALARRDVDAEARKRAGALLATVASERAAARASAARAARDRAFVARLEAIRLDAADVWGTQGDYEAATDAAYGAAFRDYGLDVDALDPAESARRIGELPPPVAEAMLVALDDWALVRTRRNKPRKKAGEALLPCKHLRDAALAADPRPWRVRARRAIFADDGETLKGLAADPGLADADPSTLELMGNAIGLHVDPTDAIAFLARARERHPSDPWLPFSEGYWCLRHDPPRYAEAAERFWVAIALRPESAAMWSHYGLAQLHQGALDRALAAYRRAAKLEPTHSGAHFGIGEVLIRQDDDAGAVAAFERAIALNPDLAPAHYALGCIRQKEGKLDEARAAYEAAVRAAPEYAQAHNNLGVVLREMKRYDEARAAFERALACDPELPEALENIGSDHIRRGERDRAIAALEKAIAVAPERAPAHRLLGSVLFKRGDVDRARASFARAAELAPEDPVAVGEYAKCLDRLGEPDVALDLIRKAVELDPENAANQHTLGVILMNRKGDYAGAIAALEETLRLDPDYGRRGGWFNLGTACLGAGKIDRAIEAFEAAIERNPEDADSFVNLAVAHQRRDEHREAVEACRKAIAIAPRHAEAHFNLGLSLRRLAAPRRAAAAFREALRLQPQNLRARLHLASTLRDAGDFDGAFAAARAAVEAVNHPDANYVLGDIQLIRTDVDDATASYECALRLRAAHVGTLFKLGHCLRLKGRYADALRALRRGAALAAKTPGGDRPFTAPIADCERLQALEASLDAVARGEEEPKTAHHRALLAEMAKAKRRFALAARLVAEDEVSPPGEDGGVDPYERARTLARAGAAGDDAATPDERAAWRARALALLTAELAAEEKKLDDASRAERCQTLLRLGLWRHDRDLARVRDDAALATLPPPEQEKWRALWQRVRALHARVTTMLDEEDP
jgi:serine/threonine-protein kinase